MGRVRQHPAGYAAERDDKADYMRDKRASDKDIEAIPEPADKARRARTKGSLREFILAYRVGFGEGFDGAFFPDQLEQIADIETAVFTGSDKALAAMRGGGKTSIERAATVWVAVHGHSDYTILVGAKDDDAADNLETIKWELDGNETLAADFPEICMPIQALAGSSRRATAQTVAGRRTRVVWGLDRIVLPDCGDAAPWQEPGSRNAVIESKSIGGAIRGRNFHNRRPKLVFLDDVENDASVRSATETAARRRRIENDIGGLGGHRSKLTRVYVGTIMDRDSVTAELTNRVLRPQWNGTRYAYMQAFPKRADLWEQYCTMRRDVVGGGPTVARAFYEANRAAMDEGALVAWPEGYRPEEHASAVEKYYAKLVDKGDEGLRFVACEYQNNPDLMAAAEVSRQLRAELIVDRLNRLEQWRIPSDAVLVTGQVDVHGAASCLYWLASWWRSGFGGGLLCAGTWPPRGTIAERYPEVNEETAIGTALADLEKWLMARSWKTDDGRELLPVFGEDSGAGQHQQIVFRHCRSAARRNWRPTKGENVKDRNYNELHRQALVRGEHWVMSPQQSEALKVGAYLFDANWWKGFVRARLQAPVADPTAYTLWGANPALHAELARHWSSEESETLTVKTTSREYDQWLQRPNRPNHWWDCLVGSAVIASSCGLKFGQAVGNMRNRPKEPSNVEVIEL